MEPLDTRHGKVAYQFACSIANGDFSAAHDLLADEQKIRWKSEYLKEQYSEMIEYGEGPVTHIEVMSEMTEWPAKQNNDIGWVYVSMSGEGYGEAVAVVVCNENNQLRIRELEWGRP